MKIVTYKLKGIFNVRGINFKEGVAVKVADNIGNYIKQTFPNSFIVEDVKDNKKEMVIKEGDMVTKNKKDKVKGKAVKDK